MSSSSPQQNFDLDAIPSHPSLHTEDSELLDRNDVSSNPSSSKETPKPGPPNLSHIEVSSPELPMSTPDVPSPALSLEAKKLASLQAKIENLERQIKETEARREEVDGKLKDKDAQATVKAHIKLLHDYNEIRDIGQGLMGIIADTRGVRVRDVYKDFDVAEGD